MIKNAVIAGHDGNIWATSKEFKVSISGGECPENIIHSPIGSTNVGSRDEVIFLLIIKEGRKIKFSLNY